MTKNLYFDGIISMCQHYNEKLLYGITDDVDTILKWYKGNERVCFFLDNKGYYKYENEFPDNREVERTDFILVVKSRELDLSCLVFVDENTTLKVFNEMLKYLVKE